MSSWLDKVIVSKAVIKSKGDDKQKAQYALINLIRYSTNYYRKPLYIFLYKV